MKKALSDLKPLLLDVNALLALGWPNHQFHAVIVERLDRKPAPRWATCALTQLGFVRLSCNPAVVGIPKSPREAADLLAKLVADRAHVFIGALPPLTELSGRFERILGHQQVTDAYLAAVAAQHGATLLTFDPRMTIASAGGIEVLTAIKTHRKRLPGYIKRGLVLESATSFHSEVQRGLDSDTNR